jgi:hypothetical protein
MKIFYKNTAALAAITADISSSYDISKIYSGWLYDYVLFQTNAPIITFEFNTLDPVIFEALGICYTNAFACNIKAYRDGVLIFEKFNNSLNGEIVNIVETGSTENVNKIEVELLGLDIVYCGYIYIGTIFDIGNFLASPSYATGLINEGQRTQGGQAYGIKGEILREWRFNFRQFSNAKRLEFEQYVRDVQYITPHIIKPYEAGEVEPLFVTLASIGDIAKETRNNFYWQFEIGYKEAK